MVSKNKYIAMGLAAMLLALNGCGDRAKEKVEGQVLYSDGVLFGVTTDPNLNPADMYTVTSKEGNVIGNIRPDHKVYDKDNNQVGTVECEGTTENAYNENEFLVGTCSLNISSIDANRGLSAYEIAVRHGFVGTETQWVASLNGRDGRDGKNGINGKDGANGGKDGKNGKDGAQGARGQKGEKGDQGVKGDQGAKGDSASLVTPPEYICSLGDNNPKCGINQNDFILSELIFSEEQFATEQYNYGGTGYHDIIRGLTESITWRVESTNGIVASDYTINNQWENGRFVSDTADFSPVKRYRLASIDGMLTIEHEDGRKATIKIDESGRASVVNSGLTIENHTISKELCFTAEREACISYLPIWTAK